MNRYAINIPRISLSITDTCSVRSLVFLIVFFTLCIRLHEYAHILVGVIQQRTFYSKFGSVAFNGGVHTFISAGGPLFSYLLMWTGLAMMLRSDRLQYPGFVLLFASSPLFRLTNTRNANILGGYDELNVAEAFQIPFPVTLLVLTVVILPPLWIAFVSIRAKFKIAWFSLFFIAIPIASYALILVGDRIILPILMDPHFAGGRTMVSFHGIPMAVIVFDMLLVLALLFSSRTSVKGIERTLERGT